MQPIPRPQTGMATVFKRHKPDESEILEEESLQRLYDFIRMLDAKGYPKAYIIYKEFRYDFSRAAFYDGRIVADVVITRVKETTQ